MYANVWSDNDHRAHQESKGENKKASSRTEDTLTERRRYFRSLPQRPPTFSHHLQFYVGFRIRYKRGHLIPWRKLECHGWIFRKGRLIWNSLETNSSAPWTDVCSSSNVQKHRLHVHISPSNLFCAEYKRHSTTQYLSYSRCNRNPHLTEGDICISMTLSPFGSPQRTKVEGVSKVGC